MDVQVFTDEVVWCLFMKKVIVESRVVVVNSHPL
jgi:hypothetical protein